MERGMAVALVRVRGQYSAGRRRDGSDGHLTCLSTTPWQAVLEP